MKRTTQKSPKSRAQAKQNLERVVGVDPRNSGVDPQEEKLGLLCLAADKGRPLEAVVSTLYFSEQPKTTQEEKGRP